MEYRIREADIDRLDSIRQFVSIVMSSLYPKGAYQENPHDLVFFEQVYVQPAHAGFFIAERSDGELLGTAAVRPYDRRFPELESAMDAGAACEMVKFYIHPDGRRQGIGSRLYERAERFAREAGYDVSYLHTSLYLPGGYPFWRSCGYVDCFRESEQIVHMSKRL